MFWLLRKLFNLGILIAIVFLAFQFPIAGKPVKDHLMDLYLRPKVKEWAHNLVKDLPAPLAEIVEKELNKVGNGQMPAFGPAMEEYKKEEEEELQKLLKKEIKK